MTCCQQFSYELQNVIYVGMCFMVLFASDYTVTNMQKTLFNSIHHDNPDFSVEGYTSLAMLYTVFAFSLILGPSMVAALGMKYGMAISAVCYMIYILAFNVEKAWAIYAVVVMGGVAGGILWTAEGKYVVLNSTPDTITRNVSIFWAFLQSSSLFGNLFTFYKFFGKSTIDGPTRRTVIYVLGAFAGVSAVMFLFIRPVQKKPDSLLNAKTPEGPLLALHRTWKLFISKEILVLNIMFCYTGLQHAFIYAVYSPTIGFTQHFGNRSKQLLALSGIFIALGEVVGGGVQIAFSNFINRFTYKRIGVNSCGFIMQNISYILIFINLPNSAVFDETNEISLIEPNESIAILCSFLLGAGDCCLNTQNFSIIGVIFPENGAQSSALYKFIKSFFVAVGLFASSQIGLHNQLIVLAPMSLIGLVAFFIIDRSYIEKSKLTYDDISLKMSDKF